MLPTINISARSIPATINYISKIINVPFSYMREHILGNINKTNTSIDVAIDSNKFVIDKIYSDLKRSLGNDGVTITKDLDVISAIVPIKGNFENGYVIVNFMFTHNTKWAKFNFFNSGSSKYNSNLRSKLLAAIIESTNELQYENDKIVRKKGWVWVPSKGLEFQIRERPIDRNGKRTNIFKVIYRGEIESDPNSVAKFLFPDDKSITPEQLNSVEDIMKLIKIHKSPKEQREILNILKSMHGEI